MENGIKERKKKVSAENKPVKQRQPKAEGVAEKEKTAVKPRKTVIKVEELYREYAKLSHGDEETESILLTQAKNQAVAYVTMSAQASWGNPAAGRRRSLRHWG